MIEEIELKQTDKAIESVGVYVAPATTLSYISKLKKDRDRVKYLLAECRAGVGRYERFISADRKKIAALEVELRSCREERTVLENRVDAQRAIIEEKDHLLEKQGREILTLRDMYDGVWDKLDIAKHDIEGLEAEVADRQQDTIVLMKVVELFKEFGTMSGMVATRDLRCIRDLLETYLTVPTIPETPVNKTIANAKRIMADAISLMEAKNADYGDSWRMMRTPSITDQILVKVHRIRSIEESPDAPKVSEGVESEYRDILNYCVFAMIQIQERSNDKEPKVNGNKTLIIDEGKLKPLHCMCKQVPWVV